MPTLSTLELLRKYESRNVTFIETDGSWPMVWQKAKGMHVWDEEGRKYLDLTAAFGVAAAGHANPRVVRAGQKQLSLLPHGMGDVHPHRLKAELAAELSHVTFERWTSGKATAKSIFCNSGFEAVEAALKTALLATGKPGVIAFENAYHGLGYGALNTTHREYFRSHFRAQLGEFALFVPFPGLRDFSGAAFRVDERSDRLKTVERLIRGHLRRGKIGAVLVEPVQARGGVNVPPPEFLPLLRRLCDEHKTLLVLDEIYTGFGRTGKWFAAEHTRVVPDLICLGKALTGGFPLSVCVGQSELMDRAWPRSSGEAIHTSTFLGNPVGCAMALANLREIRQRRLIEHSSQLGRFLLKRLLQLIHVLQPSCPLQLHARGQGLLVGLEIRLPDGAPATAVALGLIKSLLARGFIFLPEGEFANVISFTPPLTISQTQLATAVDALARQLDEPSL